MGACQLSSVGNLLTPLDNVVEEFAHGFQEISQDPILGIYADGQVKLQVQIDEMFPALVK
jgi:hypothetical protein